MIATDGSWMKWERRIGMRDFIKDPRFEGIKPFENRVWLSSPTMHGEEQKWINDAFETLVR
jgi:hypothetical protein